MFGWAVEHGLIRFNPAREVRKVRYATAGFHAWTVDEVRQFEEKHPVGTKARLALALLLYFGVRRGDVVTLGRQHVKDGWFAHGAEKNAPQATGTLAEASSESPSRHYRAQPDW
jgi:integrase